MTKHRRTIRRSQKGGFSLFKPGTWFGSSEPEDPNKKSFIDSSIDVMKSGVNATETGLGQMGNTISSSFSSGISSVSEGISRLNPFDSSSKNTLPPPQVATLPPYSYGGRLRRPGKSMKGGKGGLGLTYYAAPVSGLKVAEPTSWQYYANGTNQYSVKGGSRKRRGRKSRRTRRHKKH